MPVLFVSHIPELDRVVRVEAGREPGRFRMEEPIAMDQRLLRRLRPELMHHHIVRDAC